MKSYFLPSSTSYANSGATGEEKELVSARLRLFYTFFALKEAYIKMTGEALLAGWLRELEFRGVRAPVETEEGEWGEVVRDVEVWFRGRRVEGLRVEVVGFGRDFVVALVGRGLGGEGKGEGTLLGRGMKEVSIERDVRVCADGRCGCLDDRHG